MQDSSRAENLSNADGYGPIRFTSIRIVEPSPHGKSFNVVGDQLVDQGARHYLHGFALTNTAADIWAFRDVWARATAAHHLVAGVAPHESRMVVTAAGRAAPNPDNLPVVSRNNADFPFPEGPGLLFVDCDLSVSPQRAVEMLHYVPGLTNVSCLARGSTGSNIFDEETSKALRGDTGAHIVLGILDARDTPRALNVLHKRQWLAGNGFIKHGVDGSMYDRSIVDTKLETPSQPLYCAAHVGKGLSQVREIYEHRGESDWLDSAAVLPDLTEQEEAQYRALVAQAKSETENVTKARAFKDAYIECKAAALVGKGTSPETARATVECALDSRDLAHLWEVSLCDGATVTVADILASPNEYHGKPCRDPLEPEYGGTSVAKIFSDQDKPVINSHAHGGRQFFLQPDPFPEDEAALDVAEPAPASAQPEASEVLPSVGGVTPVNIFGASISLPEWNPADYPKVVADLAIDISRRMGVDPVIPAWSAIVAAGALAHDRMKIRVKANDTRWRESARLWTALVGDPSTKKTPGMSEVMRPINALQARFHKEYADKLQKWEQAAARARKEKQAEPARPHQRKVLVHDTTTEALADAMEHNDGGILCVRDELSGWFGSFDTYRNQGVSKDRAEYLQMYNGEMLFVDRINRGSRCIANASLSMIGGIQPGAMRRHAKGLGDDGLLQRFMTLMVRNAETGADVAPDQAAHDAWEDTVAYLAGMLGFEIYTLSPEAQDVMDAARQRIYQLGNFPGFDARLRTAIQKGEAQLARLTLAFHLLEDRTGVSEWGDPEASPVVGKETAERAARVYLHAVVPNMVAFYSEVAGTGEGVQHARWVADHILAHRCETITRRDIYRAYNEMRGEEGDALITSTMEQLESAGWVSALRPDKSERKPKAWAVNPRAHEIFAGRAERERVRREQVVAKFQAAANAVGAILQEA